MPNGLNKKLADLLGKVDDKVLQAKLNAAVDMLKNGEGDELAKKLNKMDKDELLSKISEFDESKLKELNINKDEVKQKLDTLDLSSFQKMLGDHGEEIISKIKDIINS